MTVCLSYYQFSTISTEMQKLIFLKSNHFNLKLYLGIHMFDLFQWYIYEIIIVYCTELRSSGPEVLCEKVFLEISQNWQENTCARVSYLIKLQAAPAKRDSGTGVYLWILRNF